MLDDKTTKLKSIEFWLLKIKKQLTITILKKITNPPILGIGLECKERFDIGWSIKLKINQN